VHAGLLNVLHDDAADNGGLAVTDRININLDGRVQEVIQKHRAVIGDQDGAAHVFLELILGVDDLHGPATEHIGGAHHQRIADVPRHKDAFFKTPDGGIRWLLEPRAG